MTLKSATEVQEAYQCEERAGYGKSDCQCILALAGMDGHYHERKHECIHGFQWFESWVSLTTRHLAHVAVAQALPVEGKAKV